VTNLYLSRAEYDLLSQLPGNRVLKRRYSLAGGSLDLYGNGETFFEIEFASEAEAASYVPPSFVSEEVTDNQAYSGAAFAARGA